MVGRNAFGYLVVSLIVLCLVFAGCAQPQSPSGAGTGAGPGAGAGSGTGPGAGEQEQQQEQVQEQQQGGGAADLSMQTCFALMGTGVPVECTMTMEYQGESTTVKFFMRGEDKMRYEVPNTGSEECSKMVSIAKDGKVYIGCEGQKYMGTSCDWYMVPTEPAQGGSASGEQQNYDYASQMEDMPTTTCSCVPWIFDEGKLNTPGKVCNEEEFMQELMGDFDYSQYQ